MTQPAAADRDRHRARGGERRDRCVRGERDGAPSGRRARRHRAGRARAEPAARARRAAAARGAGGDVLPLHGDLAHHEGLGAVAARACSRRCRRSRSTATWASSLFFVISGFVICMSTWGRTLGDFFRSRVARLYPAYWVAVLLITAASLRAAGRAEAAPGRRGAGQPVDAAAAVRHAPGDRRRLDALGRGAVLPAVRAVRGVAGVTYRRVVGFAMLWLVAAVVANGVKAPFLDAIVMPMWAPFFCGGLALYLVHRYGSDLLLWGIVAVVGARPERRDPRAVAAAGHEGRLHRAARAVARRRPDPLLRARRSRRPGLVPLRPLAVADGRRCPDLSVLPGARAPRLVLDPRAAPVPPPAGAAGAAAHRGVDAHARLADPPLRRAAARSVAEARSRAAGCGDPAEDGRPPLRRWAGDADPRGRPRRPATDAARRRRARARGRRRTPPRRAPLGGARRAAAGRPQARPRACAW
nr:acyltransferase family protein [Angustibacter aerolatus]